MWILAASSTTEASLLGAAAVVTAICGLTTTALALRKNRSEEHELCLERLKNTRTEAERLATELHQMKMREERED
jgi:hypothetical protein